VRSPSFIYEYSDVPHRATDKESPGAVGFDEYDSRSHSHNDSSEAQSTVSEDEKLKAPERQDPAEEINPNQRRYNMYPQKMFGGHVETRVLQDGRIQYTLFPFPYDGSDKRVIIVDPANPEEMRAVKQLHLIPDIKNDPGVGVYVFDADLLGEKKKD
jgi:hypothetical protein